jgi:hypothetical protein
MKVFVTDIFDAQAAHRLTLTKADALLCNQLKQPAPEGLSIYDANSERISGTWEAWNSNAPVIASLLRKAPGLRFQQDIDLMPAIQKTALWANRKYGYLEAWLKKHPDMVPVAVPDLYPISRVKFSLKYLKQLLQSRRKTNNSKGAEIPKGATVALMVEDMFECNILLPVARELGREQVCWVLPPKAKFKAEELQELKKHWQVWKAPSAPRLHIPFVPLYRLNKSELFCLNAWLNDYQQIADCLFWGEQLFQGNTKVLVGLAQENTHVGHILCALAAKHGKHVVNTMNGIKSAEAISAGTTFSAWIVWDEAMKRLLSEKVHVPEAQLVVAGSLQQDALANPEYTGSMPITPEEVQNKLVISVVSAKDLRMDKVEALDALYAWANAHSDCVVLYRPHPLETEDFLYLPKNPAFHFEVIKPGIASHKQSLKDQLLLSDLVINFGSTVSIEAQWIGTPCITYEKKNESDLYCVDGKTLIHVSEKEQLIRMLNQLSKKASPSRETAGHTSIATQYARIVQSYTTSNHVVS